MPVEAGQGFGLYVHWPYCAAKCPYCDFNSHVAQGFETDRWERALVAEIRRVADETGPRQIDTIFLGGGTPSLMPARLVAAILDTAADAWSAAQDLEITLEANPGSVEAGRLADYRNAGVNRVSLGVQALDDRSLRALGRLHSAAEARQAVALAQRLFDRVSFDLIYARQDQSFADWRSELNAGLEMAGEHLSLYQLTIEPGTVFSRRAALGQLPGLPQDDQAADQYDLTQDLCDEAGLPAYEVSNHARPGAECRHNLIAWQGGDYAGIGPGAHGRLTGPRGRMATTAVRNPDQWLMKVETAGTGDDLCEGLSCNDRAVEYILTSLRTRRGLDMDYLSGLQPDCLNRAALKPLSEAGLIDFNGPHLSATRAGWLVLNRVTEALIADQP